MFQILRSLITIDIFVDDYRQYFAIIQKKSFNEVNELYRESISSAKLLQSSVRITFINQQKGN